MRKRLLIGASIVAFGLGFATKEGFDIYQKRAYDITQYYQDGKVYKITPYKNGKKNGMVTEFRPDGRLKSYTTYVDDKKEFLHIEYDEKTNIQVEVHYENDQEISRREMDYTKKGSIFERYFVRNVMVQENEFIHSKNERIDREYYKDGQLKVFIPYLDKKKHGTEQH